MELVFWVPPHQMVLESGILGASSSEPFCSAPFGRAPAGAGEAAEAGALPKGGSIYLSLFRQMKPSRMQS
jgi:hypothetical protein